MGMDPKTKIWVGFEATVKERLPDDVVERITTSYPGLEVNGLVIEPFYVDEEEVGYGVELFDHDWDYGVKEIDLVALTEKATALKLRVAELFRSWGVTEDPKVLLLSDYS